MEGRNVKRLCKVKDANQGKKQEEDKIRRKEEGRKWKKSEQNVVQLRDQQSPHPSIHLHLPLGTWGGMGLGLGMEMGAVRKHAEPSLLKSEERSTLLPAPKETPTCIHPQALSAPCTLSMQASHLGIKLRCTLAVLHYEQIHHRCAS